MAYPTCSLAFDARTPGGRIIHRVCLDEKESSYKQPARPQRCTLCQLQKTNPSESISTVGATTRKSRGRRDANSKTPSPKTPNLLRRAVSYAEAVIEWTAAGRPERSDEEVAMIFQHFCKPCRWFNSRKRFCYGCGCRVADSGFAIFNKIKMATQHCPRDFW